MTTPIKRRVVTESRDSEETQAAPEQQAAVLVPARSISVWARIKEHKVAQWTLAYAAAAYAVLHGTEMVSNAFEWPHLLVRIVTLLLFLALPVVATIAWYHGHRAQRRVSGAELTIITVLLVIAGIALWHFGRPTQEHAAAKVRTTAQMTAVAVRPTTAAPVERSIAVLPFVDMSPAKDNEYFSDGISEELLNQLAKIPDLRVAARTSAFKFKGEKVNVQDVAQKLHVAHVLEGSVRKSGDKVRITAQLVKAADGYHLWSETYDRTLDDIFVVQDEIAGAVVKALRIRLLGTGLATSSKPQDLEAYNLALQGRYFVIRPSQENLERSIEYFRQSLERAPGYAPAWEGLSRAYTGQADWGFVPVADGYRRAREAAEKALALDPQLVDAHLTMGWIHSSYDWDWEAADASFRRALELEPGNARALMLFGTQAGVFGRWDEAIDALNKAIERDPLAPSRYTSLGLALLAADHDREAESAFRKALELDPAGARLHMAIGWVLLFQGKTEAALREMQQEKAKVWELAGLPLVYHVLGRRSESDAALAALKSKYSEEMAYQIADVHAFRGEADLAFEWLERAYDQRDGGVVDIKGDRFFRSLIGDPRYKAFLKKMKLPE